MKVKTSHFKTLILLATWAVPALAAEPDFNPGAAQTTGGNGAPTIHYLSPPTKTTKPAETQQQESDLQKIMQALGMAFGQGGNSQLLNSNGNYAEVATSDPAFTAAGGTDGRPVAASELSGTAPIIKPFQYWFDKCTQELGFGTCKFVNMGIEGDASHKARRSCHNSFTAIDVGPITCGKGTFTPGRNGSPEFLTIADCMANKTGNQLQVIYIHSTGGNMIQKSDHGSHMHVQLKGCPMVGG